MDMKAALVFQIDSAQNYCNFHREENRKEKDNSYLDRTKALLFRTRENLHSNEGTEIACSSCKNK